MGEEASWQRTQSALFEEWLKMAGAPPASGVNDFLAFWRDAMGGAGEPASRAGPWSSFQLFARSLTAYSAWLKDSQKKAADVTAVVDRMLEDLIASVDVALKAGAGMGNRVWPEPVAWPAFGLTREWQKLASSLAHAVHEEREAAAALQLQQWIALRGGAKRMRDGLRRKDGPSITSLKALYDLFIDHLEGAFQVQQQTEDYARAFGGHVNAGLRLREAMHAATRKALPMLGMPSMADIESLAQRLVDLERAIKPVAPTVQAEGDARVAAAETNEAAAAEPSTPTVAALRPVAPKPAKAVSARGKSMAGQRGNSSIASGVVRATPVKIPAARAKGAAPVKASPAVEKRVDSTKLDAATRTTMPGNGSTGRTGPKSPSGARKATPAAAKVVQSTVKPTSPTTAGGSTPRAAPTRAKPPQSFDIGSILSDRRQKS